MARLDTRPVTGFLRSPLVLATAVVASLGLLAGCSFIPSTADGPSVAADAGGASDDAMGGDPTAATVSSSSTVPPATIDLRELLTQDRFVPLAIALERSGLDTVLGELDDFVLLAPIGTAFAASETDIGIEYLQLLNRPQLLEAILRYHIVADPSVSASWRTLNGAALDVNATDPESVERVDGVGVLDQIRVRNGVVLVLPRVLLPASPESAIGAGLKPDE